MTDHQYSILRELPHIPKSIGSAVLLNLYWNNLDHLSLVHQFDTNCVFDEWGSTVTTLSRWVYYRDYNWHDLIEVVCNSKEWWVFWHASCGSYAVPTWSRRLTSQSALVLEYQLFLQIHPVHVIILADDFNCDLRLSLRLLSYYFWCCLCKDFWFLPDVRLLAQKEVMVSSSSSGSNHTWPYHVQSILLGLCFFIKASLFYLKPMWACGEILAD